MTNEVAVIDNSLKAIVPAPPQKASDDQVATAGQNADKAIQTILKDPGDFETLAQLGNIGNTEQSAASAFLE